MRERISRCGLLFNPTRINKTLFNPSLTDKREYSNLKKGIFGLKSNTVSQTWSKGVECQLFLKSWSGVSFPEIKVCRV